MADIHHSVSKSNAQSAVEDVRKLQSSADDDICCIACCPQRSQATELVEESNLLVWEGSDKEGEVEVGSDCTSKDRLRVSVALRSLEEVPTTRVHSTRFEILRCLIAERIHDTHPKHQRRAVATVLEGFESISHSGIPSNGKAGKREEPNAASTVSANVLPVSVSHAAGTNVGGKAQVGEEQSALETS